MDNPETKKYELCFWLKDDGSGVAPLARFDAVKEAIRKAGGQVIGEHQPEKRNLAYPIQKQRAGFWCEILFVSPAESIAAIKEDLKYETEILRKLIVVSPGIKAKKERAKRAAKSPDQETSAGSESPRGMQEELDSKLKEILAS